MSTQTPETGIKSVLFRSFKVISHPFYKKGVGGGETLGKGTQSSVSGIKCFKKKKKHREKCLLYIIHWSKMKRGTIEQQLGNTHTHKYTLRIYTNIRGWTKVGLLL